MSAFALVSGSLLRAPERRTSKAGKPYCTATLRVAADNTVEFWNIVAFTEAAQVELARLGEGEKIAAQGRLQIGIYQKDGETKISRSVTADCVLALRQPPKERRPKAGPDRRDDGAPWGGPDR